MSCVFGPVPSRRLGRSLGVDLVPFKTCTYDCIYCQLGRTTRKTVEPVQWIPVDQVFEEVKGHLDSAPEYITLGGSGEPTLYEGLGKLVEGIKRLTSIPLAVLTNGSLLWRPDIREGLLAADLVIPSLDAGDDALFQAVNRPHEDLRFELIVQGLIDFRREYRGRYWLEVLLLAGYTAYAREVRRICQHLKAIRPDRIHINTAVRPPAEPFAEAVPRDQLEALCRLFGPDAEVIAERVYCEETGTSDADEAQLMDMIRRRPCSSEDIAQGLRIHRSQVAKLAERLIASDAVRCVVVQGIPYYRVK
ncbi:MAG: radical SAM protein [FCB group bacterium]|jgi:wyosine [tRNA(Phe)-imidazoG37] synthetase (radical SAM superfamily)|nr:radical SAM protein [FCB group bacterium]